MPTHFHPDVMMWKFWQAWTFRTFFCWGIIIDSRETMIYNSVSVMHPHRDCLVWCDNFMCVQFYASVISLELHHVFCSVVVLRERLVPDKGMLRKAGDDILFFDADDDPNVHFWFPSWHLDWKIANSVTIDPVSSSLSFRSVHPPPSDTKSDLRCGKLTDHQNQEEFNTGALFTFSHEV